MSQMDPKALSHDLTIELYGASRYHAEENVRLQARVGELEAQLRELTKPEDGFDGLSTSCERGLHEACGGRAEDAEGTLHTCECKCHAVGDEA